MSAIPAAIIGQAFDWQTAAAGGVVGLAAVYLLRHYWKAWTSREKHACGGCGTCSAAETKPLVTLAPLPPPSARKAATGSHASSAPAPDELRRTK